MDSEESIFDIFYPLWLKRGKIIVVAIAVFSFLPICSFLLAELLNSNSPVSWKQDLKFGDFIPQSYREKIVSDNIIHSAYKENNLEKSYEEVLLLNNTTKYNVLQELLEDNYEKIVLEIISEQDADIENNNDEKEETFWFKNLNLEKNHNHLLITDSRLTETDFQKIVKSIINSFNTIAAENFRFGEDYINEINFDEQYKSDDYLIDRLLYVNRVLSNNSGIFEKLNFDSSETKFKTENMIYQIATRDQELKIRKINSYRYEISQLDGLILTLNELYNQFYTDTESFSNSNSEAELTVDAISQLIELGKDMSQINDRGELIDTMYDLNIKKNDIEKKIYNLENGVKYSHNDTMDNDQNLLSETKKIINKLNSVIKIYNQSNNHLAVVPIGETIKQTSYVIKYNIILYSILISSIFFVFYLLSVIFTHHSNKKHLKISA